MTPAMVSTCAAFICRASASKLVVLAVTSKVMSVLTPAAFRLWASCRWNFLVASLNAMSTMTARVPPRLRTKSPQTVDEPCSVV